MSIFSKIKDAKQAANRHKASEAVERHAPVETKATTIPYRHIPTHAAVDALSGAPSSWKEEDRSAIRAQNKRRTMMGRDSGYNNCIYRGSALHRSDHHAMPLVLPPDCQRAYVTTSTIQSSSAALKRLSPAYALSGTSSPSASSSSKTVSSFPYNGRLGPNLNSLRQQPTSREGAKSPAVAKAHTSHAPEVAKRNLSVDPIMEEKKSRIWSLGEHIAFS